MDVRFSEKEIENVMTRLQKVMRSGHLIWGEQQEELQERFRLMTGKAYAVTFNSCTSGFEALFAALRGSGRLRAGDYVAFQGNQFPSPVFAARRCGLRVAWVDINLMTMAVSAAKSSRELPDGSSAVVVQHTGGFLPDMEDLKSFCDEKGMLFIEDCSQALGSRKQGLYAGTWGEFALYSLAATKPLTTGQGGVVVTDSKDIADALFRLKNYGRTELFQRGEYVYKGWNMHMTELQAAVGNALFETYPDRIAYRAEVAALYDASLMLPFLPLGLRYSCQPNWYKYPVLLTRPMDREGLRKKMLDAGVELGSGLYDVPTYSRSVWDAEFCEASLPNTEEFCKSHICLPLHNNMTHEDAATVVEVLRRCT